MVRASARGAMPLVASLNERISSRVLAERMAAASTVALCSKPIPQEMRVVTTTATSTLGMRGAMRLSPTMIARASTPMTRVGQWV